MATTVDHQHIDQHYGDDYFFGGGAGYPDYLAESNIIHAHGKRYARLMRRWSRPGRILDVGSAAGFILKAFTESGWQGSGIEPNGTMAAYGREKLGLDVFHGTLDGFTSGDRFDLVSMIQVLAHFPDPWRAFQKADQWTRPGGYWLMETWNVASRTARLLGPRWHEYSPPSVLHWWNPATLRRTMARLGYQLVGTGFPQKWIGLQHARSLLTHKYGHGPLGRLTRLIPARLALLYPSEDLFWAVYRKSGLPS